MIAAVLCFYIFKKNECHVLSTYTTHQCHTYDVESFRVIKLSRVKKSRLVGLNISKK